MLQMIAANKSFLYFCVFLLGGMAIYIIIREFGWLDFSTASSKNQEKFANREKLYKQRDREKLKLDMYSTLTEFFKNILFPDSMAEKHEFYIERLNIRSLPLDRFLTPMELRGKYIALLLLGIILIVPGLFYKPILAASVVCILVFIGYQQSYEMKIRDEDEILDTYFIDIYLLMYSQLKRGSRGRIGHVVENYLDTLETSSDKRMQEVMSKFANFLLNNLQMYDESRAIAMLRTRYRNATVVNFCNVASQALQGVDNADTLLTFKMDLVRRKKDVMVANAEKLRKRGERSIYLIYLILGMFVIQGWVSKLSGVGGMGSMFG